MNNINGEEKPISSVDLARAAVAELALMQGGSSLTTGSSCWL